MRHGHARILLTGASGLLGRNFLHAYRVDHDVLGTCFSSHEEGLFRIDLTDGRKTAALIHDFRPDVVIHTVALTDVDLCETDLSLAYRVNVETIRHVVSALGRNEKRARLLVVSTDQVYDGPGPHEENRPFPRNVYALTKYCGELVALQYPDTLVLRTNFFGWSKGGDKGSFSDWLLRSIREGAPLKLFTDVLFSPLCMTTLTVLMRRFWESPLTGVYNLGSRDRCSKRDFAHRLAGRFGLNLKNAADASIESAHLKAYRPRDMSLDVKKISRDLNTLMPAVDEEIEILFQERPEEWR
jgi:dTDP-4-dehydrorhamnose reductase